MAHPHNVDVTAEVVKMAHAGGVSVEGELGCLGSLETGMMGEEDGHGAEGKLDLDMLLTYAPHPLTPYANQYQY
jgi:fructose-bisphosphate aldolase class II